MSTKQALVKKVVPKQTTFIKPRKSKLEERPKSPIFGNPTSLIQSRNYNYSPVKTSSPDKTSSINLRKEQRSQASYTQRSIGSAIGSSNLTNRSRSSSQLQRQMLPSQSMKDARLNLVIQESQEEKPKIFQTSESEKQIQQLKKNQNSINLNAIQNLNVSAIGRTRLDSFSPIRTNNQVQGQGSAVGHKGRYNVLLFYSSLINVISQNEKTQVLCSHLLKQLNSILSETTDGKTSVSSLMSLLKAVDYFKDGNFQLTEQLMNPETHVEQAHSILFYLKHIRSVGVSNLFSHTDILDHNTEPILLHLVQLFLILTKDGRLRDATDWSLSPAEVAQVRMDLQPLRMLNEGNTPTYFKDVRMVDLQYEMRALQKQMEAKHQQVLRLDSENGKQRDQIQKLQDFIKASKTIALQPVVPPQQLIPSSVQSKHKPLVVEKLSHSQPIVQAFVSPQMTQQIQQQLASAQETIQNYEREMTELKIRTANKIREFQLKEEMISEYIQQIKSDYHDQLKEFQRATPQQRVVDTKQNPKADEENKALSIKIAAMEKQLVSLKQTNAKLELDLESAKGVKEIAQYIQKEQSFQREVVDLKKSAQRAQLEIHQLQDDLKQTKAELEQVKSETTKALSQQLDEVVSQHKKELELLKKDHFDRTILAESTANKKAKDQVQSVKTEADKANLLVGTLEKRLATAMAGSLQIELLKKQVEEAQATALKQVEEHNSNLQQAEVKTSTELGLRQKIVDKLSEQLKSIKMAMDESKEEHEEEIEGMAGKIGQLKDTVAQLKEEVAQGQTKIGEANSRGQATSLEAALVADLKLKYEKQTEETERVNTELMKIKSEQAEESQKLKQEFGSVSEELSKQKADLERAAQQSALEKQQADLRQQMLEQSVAAKEKDVQIAHSIEKSLRTENEICKTDLKKYILQAADMAKAIKKIETLEAQVQSEAFAKRKLNQTIEQLQDRVEELTEEIDSKPQGMSGAGITDMSPIGSLGGMGMTGMSPMGGLGMGMTMPGMMGGMGSMGFGMSDSSQMSGMFGMALPSSLSNVGASIEVSSPSSKTNTRPQENNLLSVAEVKEVPLSPNAKDNESIADNFKAMLQPRTTRNMTKILEEAPYGHESDSSFVSKSDADSD